MLQLIWDVGPRALEAIASGDLLLPESVSFLVVGGAVALACAFLSLANELAAGSIGTR